MPEKPNCFRCVHRRDLPGSCHSRCNNLKAEVTARAHGIKKGWFYWPVNFDPVWLESCTGFSDDPADDLPIAEADQLVEILGILGRRL